MTKADFIQLLKTKQAETSLREFAKTLNVSAAYLSDIYLDRRDPGPKVARALGYICKKSKTVTLSYTRRKAA